MDPFEMPEDIRALNDDELSALLEAAVVAFDARSTASVVSPTDLDQLRALATGVASIRDEQAARLEAAQQAATEIDSLAAQVRGGSPEPVAEPVEPTTAAVETEPEPSPEAGAVAAAAAMAQRPALNLANVRRRQPRVLPEPAAPTTVITAAVDVPGYTPGQELDFPSITAGIISRANALKTAGGGVGQVISYRHPYPQELVVTDSSSAPEGTTVAITAAMQSRLPQRTITASGGWCSPSRTVYDMLGVACPDMLWDAPEIQLARGGLRYYKTPSLDVAAMTWVHTEADDISGATKPCFKVPCPDPVEVRCDAVGVCLESGILTQRHFPELVNWYLENTMIAHEIRIKQVLFAQALAGATPVLLPASMGALSAVFAGVALQAADIIERHSLCESTSLEVVFPWWAHNLFLTDLARRNGVGVDEVTTVDLQNLFTPLGVRPQWARALPPAVPADIGGPAAALDWPATLQFLIYPAGSLQVGRGEEVNLGVVHDSEKFKTNDFTALFSEECVALVDRSVDTRRVTVPICPTGATGGQTVLACPIA
ncbi:major capsid protein [Embleya sp. NPDC001921]